MYRVLRNLFICIVLVSIIGCHPTPPPGTMAFSPQTLKHRQLQSKKFDTIDEPAMLTASMEVIQDMGFIISEAESKLGVIVASKEREIDNKVERYTLIALRVLGGVSTLQGIEKNHKIRFSLVTIPDKANKNTTVRVNFQREVYDMENNLLRLETLQEQDIYVGFFAKLSKSIFLEAHAI